MPETEYYMVVKCPVGRDHLTLVLPRVETMRVSVTTSGGETDEISELLHLGLTVKPLLAIFATREIVSHNECGSGDGADKRRKRHPKINVTHVGQKSRMVTVFTFVDTDVIVGDGGRRQPLMIGGGQIWETDMEGLSQNGIARKRPANVSYGVGEREQEVLASGF
jgi:hypothetical protein